MSGSPQERTFGQCNFYEYTPVCGLADTLNFEVAGFEPNTADRVCHLPDEQATAVANRASHYRRRARECLKLANVVPPRGEAHDTIMAMAREWGRLADEEERTSKGQQQQQIQPDDKKSSPPQLNQLVGAKEKAPPKRG
jgi:hypothetical protein